MITTDLTTSFDVPLKVWASKDELIQALLRLGYGSNISAGARRLFSAPNMRIVKNGCVERCVVVSPRTLGLNGTSPRRNIYNQAKKQGLREVHPQTGAEFCLLKRTVPPGEDIKMGMVPIICPHRLLVILESRREQIPHPGGACKVTLGVQAGDDQVRFDEHSEWLFAIAP